MGQTVLGERDSGQEFTYNHQNLADISDSTVINNIEGDAKFEIYAERLRSSKISVQELEDEVDRFFVAPEGHEAIEQSLFLGEEHLVLLAAAEGGDFAGRALLTAVRGLTPRRITPSADPRFEAWQLKQHRGSAWLLNLTDAEVDDWKRVIEHFRGLREDLRQQRSMLVVVFNKERAREGGVIHLPNPDPTEVLRKRLATDLGLGSEPAAGEQMKAWVEFATRRKLLKGDSAAEAVRVAEAICDAIRYWEGLGDDGQRSLRAELKREHGIDVASSPRSYLEPLALDRLSSWEQELDRWNDHNQDKPRLKVFQLAIAVLPSGDPIQIRKAANDLLLRIDGDAVFNQGLVGPGTRLLSRESLAQLSGGKVVFPRPGFDEAVVRYFWDDWPEYRPQLLGWLMALATDRQVTTEDQVLLKERIGRFAIRHAQLRGEYEFLYEVVSKWADGDDTFADAAILLEKAATTSGIASSVRDRTLQWAKRGNAALKRVVAELCASLTFAPLHPRLVVTRLGHLMDFGEHESEDPRLAEILERACRLLVTEADQAESVLAWLGDGVNSEKAQQRDRAARLFLPIAQAREDGANMPALIRQAEASERLRTALVTLWGVVLRTRALGEIQPAFNAWMDSCGSPETETHVLGTFKDAVASELDGAGTANQTGARLSFGWRHASVLKPEHVTDIDRRLLAALRDGEEEVRKRRFDSGAQEAE